MGVDGQRHTLTALPLGNIPISIVQELIRNLYLTRKHYCGIISSTCVAWGKNLYVQIKNLLMFIGEK